MTEGGACIIDRKKIDAVDVGVKNSFKLASYTDDLTKQF